MPQDMTDDRAHCFSSPREVPGSRIELAPGRARAGKNANRLQIFDWKWGDFRQALSALVTHNSATRCSEIDLAHNRPDRGAALSTAIECGHEAQLAKARQLKPHDPFRPQFPIP
jgi:hypothetical protein